MAAVPISKPDVFTTNCVAYPVLKVKRRKYRLRFLGASIARIYEFSIQTDGDVVPAGLDAEGGIRAGNEPLCRRLLVTRRPVDLSREEETA